MTPQEYSLHKAIISWINTFNEAKLEYDRCLGDAPTQAVTAITGSYLQEKHELVKARKMLDMLDAKLELEKAQRNLEDFLKMEEDARKRLEKKSNGTV